MGERDRVQSEKAGATEGSVGGQSEFDCPRSAQCCCTEELGSDGENGRGVEATGRAIQDEFLAEGRWKDSALMIAALSTTVSGNREFHVKQCEHDRAFLNDSYHGAVPMVHVSAMKQT